MGWDYFIFYAGASIFCIVILLIMLINDRIYNTQQEKQIWFNRAIVAFILYFVSDVCWDAVLNGILPRVRILVELFNLTNFILLSVMAYEWFMFMAASEKMPFRKSRKKRLLCFIPMIVSLAVMLIAYAMDPYYWITDGGELNPMYYPLMISAPAFYLLTAFVLSIINAGKTELREEKKRCWMTGIIPIGVMGFGLLQVVSLNIPTFCFGCTMMLLFFYIQNMQMLISVDALTRLNNRGQINRYMEQIHYRENNEVFIMMIDIDRFKEINDTYGHAEGDRALILVSEVLKRVCTRLRAPCFLGRYGGDEFTVILQNPEEGEFPDQVAAAIRETLSEKQRENHLLYDLQVSIGYEALRDRDDTMEACMIRADEKLYADKRKRGAGR